MLRPGTRIRFNGADGTVERTVGPGEVIVRTSKGKFVIQERFLTVVGESSAIPIVTPEAPPAPKKFSEMTREELLAECKKRGWEVDAEASDSDIVEALESE